MLELMYSVERKSRKKTVRQEHGTQRVLPCEENPVNIGVRGMELLAGSAQNMQVQSIIVEGCPLG